MLLHLFCLMCLVICQGRAASLNITIDSVPKVIFPSDETPIDHGETCETNEGHPGSCKHLKDCAIPDLVKNKPKICEWDDITPIVCCPLTHVSKVTEDPIKSSTAGWVTPKDTGTQTEENDLAFYCGEQLDIRSTFGAPPTPQKEPENFWPWMATISLKQNSKPTPICNGVIIDEKTILTSALCFIDRKKCLNSTEYTVTLGEGNSSLARGVKKISLNENFTFPMLYNALALVHLSDKIKFSDRTQPLCLPGRHLAKETFEGKNGTFIGWAKTEKSSTELKSGQARVISNTECDKTYKNMFSYKTLFPQGISHSVLCCTGDTFQQGHIQPNKSGVMVIQDPFSTRKLLIGIMSYGLECKNGFPGIFTRITENLDWIDETLLNS